VITLYRIPVKAKWCIALAFVSIFAVWDAQTASATANSRPGVAPTSYEVSVAPDASLRSFSGDELIRIRFRRPTRHLQLDDDGLEVRDVKLDGHTATSVSLNRSRQSLSIDLGHFFSAGMHTLTLRYFGLIRTDARGLFVQSYTAANGSQQRL
jgi:hypothetical protein